MIGEVYCSREVSQALKECGFPQTVTRVLYVKGKITEKKPWHIFEKSQNVVAAPTLGLAMRWLRCRCGIVIDLIFDRATQSWKCGWKSCVKDGPRGVYNYYRKYEDAVEVVAMSACTFLRYGNPDEIKLVKSRTLTWL